LLAPVSPHFTSVLTLSLNVPRPGASQAKQSIVKNENQEKLLAGDSNLLLSRFLRWNVTNTPTVSDLTFLLCRQLQQWQHRLSYMEVC
jgi:hypothetical protein